jgi:hypothetical protein
MENTTNTTIHAFKKSETEEVRLCRRDYKGKSYLDLRLFFRAAGMNDFKPTRKGLTLPVELAAELERAFQGVTLKTAEALVQSA